MSQGRGASGSQERPEMVLPGASGRPGTAPPGCGPQSLCDPGPKLEIRAFHLRAPVWSTSLWQPQNPARHPGSGHSGGRCRRPVAGRAGARALASRAREPRRPPASGAGSASRHGAHAGRPRVQSARATAATVTTYQAPHPEKPTAWMTVRTNWAPKMKKNAMKLKELSALERRGKAREGGPASLPSPGTGPRGHGTSCCTLPSEDTLYPRGPPAPEDATAAGTQTSCLRD